MRIPAAAVLLLFFPPPAFAAAPLLDRLLIIAPAAPGGGWDQTARAMQHALETEGLVRQVEVLNIAGAAGTIGLAQFVSTHRGNREALLVSGLVMLGATIWNDSPVSVAQVTPIARLTGEYEVVAVPAQSPHRDMTSLVAALRTNPGGVSWGGGSAGGTDHILAGLIGAAAGIDPRRVNYIAFSGGGEAVASLLGGNVTAGVSGWSEFAPHIESGRLRALAISAADRAPGIAAPTLREQGLDVALSNWRAVLGAPGLSRDDRRMLTDVVARMANSPTWRKTLDDRGWNDEFQQGDDFARYLEAERLRLTRIVPRLRGSAESEPIRVGQRLFPTAILGGSILLGLLLARRASRGGPTDGPANRSALAHVAIGLVAFVLLLEPAGFVIAASLLFIATTRALQPARPPQPPDGAGSGDGRQRVPPTGFIIGVAFCVLVYIAFTRGLEVALPAGAVWPWTR